MHPLYTGKDLVFEPGLLGSWREAPEEGADSSESETWTFERGEGEEKVYRLTVLAEDGPSPFYAHLVKLDGELFLDMAPEEFGDEEEARKLPLWTALHLMPLHSFWRVWLEAEKVQIAPLDPDWLLARMKDGSIQLQHEFVNEDDEDEGFLLTAKPADLQAMMRKAAQDKEAFAGGSEMTRVESGSDAPERREGEGSNDGT
jgi:hypothetical protein